jgi:hypothetical protein
MSYGSLVIALICGAAFFIIINFAPLNGWWGFGIFLEGITFGIFSLFGAYEFMTGPEMRGT